MGIFTRVPETDTTKYTVTAAAATVPAGVAVSGLARPRTISTSNAVNIPTFVMEDIFGEIALEGYASRSQAISVPAISAARNLIAGQICRLPLKAYKDGVPVASQPTWLYRTNSRVSPQYRMLRTVDDLIFNGDALWYTVRGADGQLIDALYLDRSRWSIDAYDRILIDNVVADEGEVIYFPGFTGGLLNEHTRLVRAGLDLENTRAQRLRTPSAITEIHLTDDGELDDDEVTAVRDNYADARRTANGAVTVTPKGVQIIDHDGASVDALIEAQNSLAVNVAQALSIKASALDAAVNAGSSSFNYSSTQMDFDTLMKTGIPFWMEPITSRLSMDDCVSRGTNVQFDTSSIATPKVED